MYKSNLYDYDNEKKFILEILDKIENDIIRYRVSNLLIWYVKRASLYKISFMSSTITVSAIGVLIPIATNFAFDNSSTKIFISVLGGLSTILTAVVSLFACRENWLRYRISAEALKSEVVKYLTLLPPYCDENKDKTLVLNIEAIAKEEGKHWVEEQKKDSTKTNTKVDTTVQL